MDQNKNLFVFTKAKPSPEWKPPTDGQIIHQVFSCASSNTYLPANQRHFCNQKCALQRLGLFDDTNGFNFENIVKTQRQEGFSESVARSMAEKCAVKKHVFETNCEWASRGLDCLVAEEERQTG